MAVYPVSPNDKIELLFVLERIYSRRCGSTNITADCLIRNSGNTPVRAIRILLPYSLVYIKNPSTRVSYTPQRFAKFAHRSQKEQKKKLTISGTEKLGEPSERPNWIYRTLYHTQINQGPNGKVVVTRSGQLRGHEKLNGFVKQHWDVETPSILKEKPWMWFLLAVNGLTMLDIEVPDIAIPKYQQERLQPNEEASWFRIEFTIPADGKNGYSWLATHFSRFLEYSQWFSSPEGVRDEAYRTISAYDETSLSNNAAITASVVDAKKALPSLLPSPQNSVVVQDWRIFLYREYGLKDDKIEPLVGVPKKPNRRGIYYVPFEAYPHSHLGWAPSFFYRWFKPKDKRVREVKCQEYWIGQDHDCTDPKGYTIEISLLLKNEPLAKIAIILAVVGIVIADPRFTWFFGLVRFISRFIRGTD